MKSSRLSKRVMAPEMKQSSIFGHVNISKAGVTTSDFKFDYGEPVPTDKEASTAESTKKKLIPSKSIILVPKKNGTKKRKISQFKEKKEAPSKKRMKVEGPKIVATPSLEISALSESTKNLVAKLLKPKPAEKKQTCEKLEIKPYSSAT
jgi:hypothetical protein